MNEKGISLVETLVGVVIISIIALTLLPLVQQLQAQLYMRQLAYHATEAALNGAKMMQLFQVEQGVIEINQVMYDWRYEQHAICVRYEGLKGQQERCVST